MQSKEFNETGADRREREGIAQEWVMDDAEMSADDFLRQCWRDGYCRERAIHGIDLEVIAAGRCGACRAPLHGIARARAKGDGYRLFVYCPNCRVGYEM